MNQQLRNNKSENSLHSLLLILGMAGILSLIGLMLFGITGLAIALAVTAASAIVGPRVSSTLILRTYKAQRISEDMSPSLNRLFLELCKRADLDYRPGLYYIPSRVPNAFATGVGKNSAVAVTDGLIRLLNSRELTAVIAHEVAHLQHHDTRVMGLADTLGKLTSAVSRIGMLMLFFSGASVLFGGNGLFVALTGLLMISAPSLIAVMQLALSRSREFNADMGAAELTGDPMGLASALQKLDPEARVRSILEAVLDPTQRKQPAFLRTHPPTEERVRELMEVAKENDEAREEIENSYRDRRVSSRSGRPVLFVDAPRVNQRQRYRIASDTYR